MPINVSYTITEIPILHHHTLRALSVDGISLEYPRIKQFVEALEARKLRIFHRELNIYAVDPCCMEFSFITLDWSTWNSVTKFSLTNL